MMRVLVLTDVLEPCAQSASQRISSFVNVLSSRALRTAVVSSTRCANQATTALNAKALVYNLKYPRSLRAFSSVLLNPVLVLLFLGTSIVVALGKKIDIVLASVPNGESAIAGFFLSRLMKTLFVIDARDLYPYPSTEFQYMRVHLPSSVNDLFMRLFSLVYRKSDGITCVDGHIRDRIIALRIDPSKVEVVPNGADTSIYEPSEPIERVRIRSENGLSLEKMIFVYAGALVSWYPVDAIIKAFGNASQEVRRRVQLLIISHNDYSAKKSLAMKLGLENDVLFMGPLSVQGTARILSACDVGIVNYRSEDYFKTMYGGKIFSYLACGLPVLVSGPSGSVLDKLVSNHKVGFFVGAPNEKNWEKGLQHFLQLGDEREIMSVRARRTAEQYYDRTTLGLKLASFLELLTEKGRNI